MKGKVLVILLVSILCGMPAAAQISAASGDWESNSSWIGDNTPAVSDIQGSISINHYITRHGNLDFKLNGGKGNNDRLSVNDDLVVFGDVVFDKESIELEITDKGRMVVFGNMTAENKVSVGNAGILVVTETLSVNGGQASFTNDGSGITFAQAFSGNAITDLDMDANYTLGEMSSFLSDSRIAEVYNFVQTNGGTPLPVSWLYVKAEAEAKNINILWATAKEENNSHFEVETSFDGETWTYQETIQGAGNANSFQYYQLSIPAQGAGLYARIRQVDFDGKASYSQMIRLPALAVRPAFELAAHYPNPASDVLSVKLLADKETELHIFLRSASGYTFIQRALTLHPGHSTYTLQLNTLPAGLYILQMVDDASGKAVSKKVYIR